MRRSPYYWKLRAVGWAFDELRYKTRRAWHRYVYCQRGKHLSARIWSICTITRIGEREPYWTRTRDIERCAWCNELLTEVIRTRDDS